MEFQEFEEGVFLGVLGGLLGHCLYGGSPSSWLLGLGFPGLSILVHTPAVPYFQQYLKVRYFLGLDQGENSSTPEKPYGG